MQILITGGAGFIGSNLIDKILLDNQKVICLDNFDNFYDPNIKRKNAESFLNNKNFVLIEGDIRDKNLLNQIFREYKIDVVVHLAARAGVRYSILQPVLYYDVNVMGTLNLLEAMRLADVKRMVFASSSSIYGNNLKVPFSETDNVDNPISPYAATKKAGELLCYTYHYLYGFDIFCLRYFSVYGPRQRPEMAIHKFANNIVSNRPINIYGDGSSRRDYTFIDDIVNGTISAIKNLKGFEIINLGESKNYDIITIIKILENYLNKKAIVKYLPAQPGDVRITYADISKARKLINYNPSTDIEVGIKKFIEWFLANSK